MNGDNLYIELINKSNNFFGVEFFFVLEYHLDLLVLESEFPEALVAQILIKDIIILPMLEDTIQGFLCESDGVEENKKNERVHRYF